MFHDLYVIEQLMSSVNKTLQIQQIEVDRIFILKE